MEHDNGRATVGRREFLKRAGVVAWTVPAIHVANMTGALAGEVNSSVTTTLPPSSTRPPECVDVFYRLKAEWKDGGWVWVTGEGANDCLTGGDWSGITPNGIQVEIEGDDESATVKIKTEDCVIVQASHKEALSCVAAEIGGEGSYADFTKDVHGISHVELIIKCCVAPS